MDNNFRGNEDVTFLVSQYLFSIMHQTGVEIHSDIINWVENKYRQSSCPYFMRPFQKEFSVYCFIKYKV